MGCGWCIFFPLISFYFREDQKEGDEQQEEEKKGEGEEGEVDVRSKEEKQSQEEEEKRRKEEQTLLRLQNQLDEERLSLCLICFISIVEKQENEKNFFGWHSLDLFLNLVLFPLDK